MVVTFSRQGRYDLWYAEADAEVFILLRSWQELLFVSRGGHNVLFQAAGKASLSLRSLREPFLILRGNHNDIFHTAGAARSVNCLAPKPPKTGAF